MENALININYNSEQPTVLGRELKCNSILPLIECNSGEAG